MDIFNALAEDRSTMVEGITNLIVLNVRTVVESNFGTFGNDVMWEKYMKETREKVAEVLSKEVPS